MRMIRQTADNASPRLRSVTEGPASSQLPRPPKLKPHPGSIPTQTLLSPPPHPSVTSRETQMLSEIAPDSAPVPFSLNQNTAVCLPLLCEKRKLMWVLSNQIHVQLDSEAELDKAFSAFPYLTQRETAALAQRCSLHPDQVKVWFMLQRLRYGISWDSEDICKVQKKECNSGQAQEDEEQQNRVREDLGDGTREGKTKKGERAPKEKVRKNKWKEGGNCEGKVWCNEPRMTKMTGEEGGKRGQNDRKVEAVGEGERNIRKQGKLMVADKRKRKKIEGEEDGAEETGASNVIASFSGFEGKAGLEPKPEPELHKQSTSYNTSTLKRRKKAVVVENNPCAIDVPPVGAPCRAPHQIHSQPRTKTRVQIEMLRQSFLACQFPTSQDYDWLMVQTGLSRADLVQWFGDMRYNVKNRKPHWLKPEERCRLLARIRHQQLIKCIGSRGKKGEWKEDVEDELERKEMLIQD